MIQTFTIIAIVGFSLAAVLVVVALVIFFKLNIVQVRNDLTGKTATRSVAEIRARAKTRKRSSSEAGKKLGWEISGPIKVPSGPLKSHTSDVLTGDPLTEESLTTPLFDEDETETTILSLDDEFETETTILVQDDLDEEETTLLIEDGEEQTTLMSRKKRSKAASGALSLLAIGLTLALGSGLFLVEGAWGNPDEDTGIGTLSEGEEEGTETIPGEGEEITTPPVDISAPSGEPAPVADLSETAPAEGTPEVGVLGDGGIAPLALDLSNLSFGDIKITPNNTVLGDILYAADEVKIEAQVSVPGLVGLQVPKIEVLENGVPFTGPELKNISFSKTSPNPTGKVIITFSTDSNVEKVFDLEDFEIVIEHPTGTKVSSGPLYQADPTLPIVIEGKDVNNPAITVPVKQFSIIKAVVGARILYDEDSAFVGKPGNYRVARNANFEIVDNVFKALKNSLSHEGDNAVRITYTAPDGTILVTYKKYSDFKKDPPTPTGIIFRTSDKYLFDLEGEYTIDFVNAGTSIYNSGRSTYGDSFKIDLTKPEIENTATISKTSPLAWEWITSQDDIALTFKVSDAYTGIDWDKIEATVNGVPITNPPTYDSALGTVTLTFDHDNDRIRFDDVALTVYDKAHNASDPIDLKTLLGTSITSGTNGFIVDTVDPKVELSYGDGVASSSGYFNAPRVATFTVIENSFDLIKANEPSRGIVTITCDGSSSSIPAEEFTNPSGDGITWIANYTFDSDGDYTIETSIEDVSGRVSNTITDSFTIDQHEPMILITFDNNDSDSGNYFKATRTATITIHETNFSESQTSVSVSASDAAGNAVGAPGISGWRETEEDQWETTVSFGQELHYALSVGSTDLAGNVGEVAEEPEFVIDMTTPIVRIEQVDTNTAYADEIAPRVYFEDTNFESYRAKVSITASSRVANEEEGESGKVYFSNNEIQTSTSRTDIFDDIPYELRYDDVYTMVAEIEDKAGNISSETVVFSVNRFGSNYELSTETKRAVGSYMQKPEEIVVIETNVSGLESSRARISQNNAVSNLVDGEDYTTNLIGDQTGWTRYEYVFPAELFDEDAYYRMLLSSRDNAGNHSENLMMGKNATRDDVFEVSFAVDGTSPVASLGNVSDDATVFSPSHIVDVFAGDNMEMTEVTLYVNEQKIETWTADEFLSEGMQGYEIPASDIYNTVTLKASDRAGNTTTVNTSNILVTNDLFKYVVNTPAILYPAIAALSVLAALAVILTVRLVRKTMAARAAKTA